MSEKKSVKKSASESAAEEGAKRKVEYSDIEDIVEYLVVKKARGFAFDCWTAEDIGQEIRIICLCALDGFNPDFDESRWKNYFGRCVDNRLRNLKRDKYFRPGSTCKKDCSLAHEEVSDEFPEGTVCAKWTKARENAKRKLLVKHPFPINDMRGTIRDPSGMETLESVDLRDYLVSRIPEYLRGHLKNMMNDTGNVPDYERALITRLASEILD